MTDCFPPSWYTSPLPALLEGGGGPIFEAWVDQSERYTLPEALWRPFYERTQGGRDYYRRPPFQFREVQERFLLCASSLDTLANLVWLVHRAYVTRPAPDTEMVSTSAEVTSRDGETFIGAVHVRYGTELRPPMGYQS